MSSLLRTSIGKKVIVAVTGLLLFGFVLMHLAGNLTIFLGPDALNAYAEKLRHLGGLLWVARAALLAAALAHIAVSVQVTIENRRARPSRYAVVQPAQSTVASRSMIVSGLTILAFLAYHLAHFTFRVTHPDMSNLTDALGRHDVYSMVVYGFQQPVISGLYVTAMALLCLHLGHGLASTCQTLGWADDRTMPVAQRIGAIVAGLIAVGYCAIPVSVLAGWLK